jgi:sugar phosphate isomerase/epimerase
MTSRDPRTLTAKDLVLCAGTLHYHQLSFAERVAATRAAGFDAITLMPAAYRRAREQERLSDADMRALLAEQGLCIAELDPLLSWVPGHPFTHGDMDAGAQVDTFMAIADALGARSLNVVLAVTERLPEQLLVDAFAAVCKRSAEHGLLAHLEFLPWAQTADVKTACRLAQLAGCANGGVMFDTWHHFRGGLGNDVLDTIPGELILGIQVNDAPAAAEADVISETMQRRRLPGDGDMPLADMLRRLRQSGCTAPLGIEVFSTDLGRLPVREAAQRAGDSMRRLVAKMKAGHNHA